MASSWMIPVVSASIFVVIIAVVLWASPYFGPENH